MKKLLALILALAMLFTLAACTPDTDDDDDRKPSKSDTTSSDASPDTTSSGDTSSDGDNTPATARVDLLTECIYYSEGESKTTFTYNAQNLLTGISASDEYSNTTTTVFYGNDGKVNSTMEILSYEDMDGNPLTRSTGRTYFRNGNGQITKINLHENNSDGGSTDFYYTYEYDANGNLVKSVCQDDELSFKETITYEYDRNGNLSAKKFFYGDSQVYDSIHNYEYDINNRLTKLTALSNAGEVLHTVKCIYSDTGVLLTTQVVGDEDTVYGSTDYIFRSVELPAAEAAYVQIQQAEILENYR